MHLLLAAPDELRVHGQSSYTLAEVAQCGAGISQHVQAREQLERLAQQVITDSGYSSTTYLALAHMDILAHLLRDPDLHQ